MVMPRVVSCAGISLDPDRAFHAVNLAPGHAWQDVDALRHFGGARSGIARPR